MLIKGNIDAELDEALRPLSDRQIGWIEALVADESLEKHFNIALMTGG